MSEPTTATGGCLCGAVQFTVDRSGAATAHHCHCDDCKRSTGCGKATFVMVTDGHMNVTRGEAKFYSVAGASGGQVHRGFCAECGSPLFSRVDVLPGMYFVKAGAFDDSSWIEPVSSFWATSATGWSPVDAAIEAHDHNPG